MKTIWTIGHSNHSLNHFLELIARHQITIIADVRSRPYSSRFPHFTKHNLEKTLREAGMDYVFLGEHLGGMPADDRYYDADGFVLYERLAAAGGFQQAIDRLLDNAAVCRMALLCGEEDPAACHRRLLLGRVLADRGVDVLHIRRDGTTQRETDLAAGQQTDLFAPSPAAWRSAGPVRR